MAQAHHRDLCRRFFLRSQLIFIDESGIVSQGVPGQGRCTVHMHAMGDIMGPAVHGLQAVFTIAT